MSKKNVDFEYDIRKINKSQIYKIFSIFNIKKINKIINNYDDLYALTFINDNKLYKTIVLIDKENKKGEIIFNNDKIVKCISINKVMITILNQLIYNIIKTTSDIDYLKYIEISYCKKTSVLPLDLYLFKMNLDTNINDNLGDAFLQDSNSKLYLNSTKIHDNRIQISIILEKIIIYTLIIKKNNNKWLVAKSFCTNYYLNYSTIMSVIGKLISEFMITLNSELYISSTPNDILRRDIHLNFKNIGDNLFKKEYGGYYQFKPIINNKRAILLEKPITFYMIYCGFNEKDIKKCLKEYDLSKADTFEFKCNNGSIDIVGNKIYIKSKDVKKRCNIILEENLVKINLL